MQLDAILEVAIGLVMTWLIISMATSQVQESIIDLLGWRSKFLEQRVREMFNGQDGLVARFYDHPLVKSLNTKMMFWDRKPVNIPNPIFAKAAVDVFLNAGSAGAEIPAGSMSLQQMMENLDASMTELESTNAPLARTVKHLVPNLNVEVLELDQKLAEYRRNVEDWFDTTMGKATNLYRKYAATIALVIGFGLAFALNVDSIHITSKLWHDPTLRQTIVAQAGNIDPNDEAGFEATKKRLEALTLPVGWTADTTPANQGEWTIKVFGFFLTGLAAAQGSPFWFDILRRLAGLKSQPAQAAKSE